MLARDIMTKDVVTVEPQTSVQAIAELLLKHRISAVPVVNQSGAMIGIVSEDDLMRRLEDVDQNRSWWLSLFSSRYHDAADFVKARGQHAGDLATQPVVTLDEDTSINEIARLLERHNVKRAPVLRDGKLVGIVTRGDLMRTLAATRPHHPPVHQNDSALRDAVEEALKEIPGLVTAYVSVTVHDGIVEIWGIAGSNDQARAVRIAAENVPGVKTVQTHLGHVAPWVVGT